MTEERTSCPRCGAVTDTEYSFCPRCGMSMEAPGFDATTLRDRIRYIRRDSATRTRRHKIVRRLANAAVAITILILVGGGILLFHPSLVPSLFKPAPLAPPAGIPDAPPPGELPGAPPSMVEPQW